MRKLLYVAAAALFSLPVCLQGQSVSFRYGTDFDYFFENREFDALRNTYYGKDGLLPVESCTCNSLVLTPTIGLVMSQGPSVRHRLSLGIDIRRDMGSGAVSRKTLDELVVYYDALAKLGDGSSFKAMLGTFPNRLREGEYGNAHFSRYTLFNDRNMDGLLLKYRAERFYGELAADWIGMKTQTGRERFMIVSAGNWKLMDWLDAGWSGTFYHYASSETVHGVVDNNLAGLYVRANFAQQTGLQELSLKLSGLFTYQWDRKFEPSQSFPKGFETMAVVRKWNVYLSNCSYVGDNLQYLYSHTDAGGFQYGSALYFGDPFYQCPFWDRVAIGWEPRIGDFISLKIDFEFHFSDAGFLGWTQRLGFALNLDKKRQ